MDRIIVMAANDPVAKVLAMDVRSILEVAFPDADVRYGPMKKPGPKKLIQIVYESDFVDDLEKLRREIGNKVLSGTPLHFNQLKVDVVRRPSLMKEQTVAVLIPQDSPRNSAVQAKSEIYAWLGELTEELGGHDFKHINIAVARSHHPVPHVICHYREVSRVIGGKPLDYPKHLETAIRKGLEKAGLDGVKAEINLVQLEPESAQSEPE